MTAPARHKENDADTRRSRVDPARVQKTIDIMTPALELKRKVTVDEVYAPGFLTQ